MELIKIELIVEAKGQVKIPPIVVPDDWEYVLCKIQLTENAVRASIGAMDFEKFIHHWTKHVITFGELTSQDMQVIFKSVCSNL